MHTGLLCVCIDLKARVRLGGLWPKVLTIYMYVCVGKEGSCVEEALVLIQCGHT